MKSLEAECLVWPWASFTKLGMGSQVASGCSTGEWLRTHTPRLHKPKSTRPGHSRHMDLTCPEEPLSLEAQSRGYGISFRLQRRCLRVLPSRTYSSTGHMLTLPVPLLDDCLLGRVGVTADHPGESGRDSATPRIWQTPKGRRRSWVHVGVTRWPQVGPGEAGALGSEGWPAETCVLNNGGV